MLKYGLLYHSIYLEMSYLTFLGRQNKIIDKIKLN